MNIDLSRVKVAYSCKKQNSYPEKECEKNEAD